MFHFHALAERKKYVFDSDSLDLRLLRMRENLSFIIFATVLVGTT